MLTELLNQQYARRWYAVYVRSRHEKCVATQFGLKCIEHFLATYKEMHKWKNGCRKQVDLPLFPGYLFARIDLSQRLRVLECSGVIRFVGFNGELTPMEDGEVESLRVGLQEHWIRPHSYLRAGTKVRVRGGAFEGKTGILIRDQRGVRVVMSIELLKRAIAVELDMADVDVLPDVAPQMAHLPAAVTDCEPVTT